MPDTLRISHDARFNSRQCPFCNAIFSRVDATRRHALRCPQRGGRELHTKQRGRRAKACELCSRVKVHCGRRNDGPCERCFFRGLNCSFIQSFAGDFPLESPDDGLTDDSQSNDQTRIPMSFLLNSTDDKQDYVTERAVGEEPNGDLLGPMSLPSSGPGLFSSSMVDFIDPSILLEDCSWPFEVDDPGTMHDPGLDSMTSPKLGDTRLSDRLDLLELELESYSRYGARQRGVFDVPAYRSFFNAHNVQIFTTTFCRKRHYQYPIIHWPTFVLEEVSLPLLLTVALMGSSYSLGDGHGVNHIVNGRQFYRLADAYVFDRLDACLETLTSEQSPEIVTQLCQAALLMYALDMLLTSDPEMQHLAVTKRLPALISTLRKMDFIRCQHEASEDWNLFARREEIIRTVAWTYCADCLAVLSCNKPPGVSLTEMSGDLPCDPAQWEAQSGSAFRLIKHSESTATYNLKELMTGLFQGNETLSRKLEALPVFHLHIMLCGMWPMRHLSIDFIVANTGNMQLFSHTSSIWTLHWPLQSNQRGF